HRRRQRTRAGREAWPTRAGRARERGEPRETRQPGPSGGTGLSNRATAQPPLPLLVQLAVLADAVDDAVFLGLLGSQDLVAVGVAADLLGGLAGVVGERFLHEGAHALDFGGLDFEVGDLALDALGGGLVDEHAGVGQGGALAGGAGGE